jgi:hypothetical protein
VRPLADRKLSIRAVARGEKMAPRDSGDRFDNEIGDIARVRPVFPGAVDADRARRRFARSPNSGLPRKAGLLVILVDGICATPGGSLLNASGAGADDGYATLAGFVECHCNIAMLRHPMRASRTGLSARRYVEFASRTAAAPVWLSDSASACMAGVGSFTTGNGARHLDRSGEDGRDQRRPALQW